MPREKTDLSLLADRFLAFFAYQLADQERFNEWIDGIMVNREHNPGALALLNLLLNKALPTPQSVKVTGDGEGFKLTVKWEGPPTASASTMPAGEFKLTGAERPLPPAGYRFATQQERNSSTAEIVPIGWNP